MEAQNRSRKNVPRLIVGDLDQRGGVGLVARLDRDLSMGLLLAHEDNKENGKGSRRESCHTSKRGYSNVNEAILALQLRQNRGGERSVVDDLKFRIS